MTTIVFYFHLLSSSGLSLEDSSSCDSLNLQLRCLPCGLDGVGDGTGEVGMGEGGSRTTDADRTDSSIRRGGVVVDDTGEHARCGLSAGGRSLLTYTFGLMAETS